MFFKFLYFKIQDELDRPTCGKLFVCLSLLALDVSRVEYPAFALNQLRRAPAPPAAPNAGSVGTENGWMDGFILDVSEVCICCFKHKSFLIQYRKASDLRNSRLIWADGLDFWKPVTGLYRESGSGSGGKQIRVECLIYLNKYDINVIFIYLPVDSTSTKLNAQNFWLKLARQLERWGFKPESHLIHLKKKKFQSDSFSASQSTTGPVGSSDGKEAGARARV